MTQEQAAALRLLPSVDEAVRDFRQKNLVDWPRWAVLQAIRAEIAEQRQAVLAGTTLHPQIRDGVIEAQIKKLLRPSLRSVINATGVVLHTNLGRAPLSARAIERIQTVARGYSNVEYEVAEGGRGSRHHHAATLISYLTGGEAAVVVNNNAAAVLLGLAAMAPQQDVIVSRGELVEIGGSFRLPDVMSLSQARLVEVGTTNRTHLADYERAIRATTGLLLKVHRSNFTQSGFVAEVAPAELVALGRSRGIATMFDLGSGTLLDLTTLGLPAEPTVQSIISAGFDLVTFSADKLLGGPQAGLIVGTQGAITRVRSHPLMRALRPDKLTLAALEATLETYRDTQAPVELPALAMLAVSSSELHDRAHDLCARLTPQLLPPWSLEVVPTRCPVGGGALPEAQLDSFAIRIDHPGVSAVQLEQRLRRAQPPIIARIDHDQVLLDLRTLSERDRLELIPALVEMSSEV